MFFGKLSVFSGGVGGIRTTNMKSSRLTPHPPDHWGGGGVKFYPPPRLQTIIGIHGICGRDLAIPVIHVVADVVISLCFGAGLFVDVFPTSSIGWLTLGGGVGDAVSGPVTSTLERVKDAQIVSDFVNQRDACKHTSHCQSRYNRQPHTLQVCCELGSLALLNTIPT